MTQKFSKRAPAVSENTTEISGTSFQQNRQLSISKQINKMSNEGNNFEFLSQRARDILMSSHFNQAPHAMPSPTNVPWNAGAMPWTMPAMPVNEIIEFKGQGCILGQNKLPSHCKRKSDIDYAVPRKQLITEEKMAAHLNGLHISSQYVSHNANQEAAGSFQQPTDISMDTDLEGTPLTMTAKELEEKINSGGRLVISEEIKKFTENEEIIPKVLLERIERPCKALVLWQPPSKRNNFLLPTNCFDKENDDEEEDDDDEKAPSKDSNTMDLDM